jgi:hypothetical protein
MSDVSVIKYVARAKWGGRSWKKKFASNSDANTEMAKQRAYPNPKLERVYQLYNAPGDVTYDLWIRGS